MLPEPTWGAFSAPRPTRSAATWESSEAGILDWEGVPGFLGALAASKSPPFFVL